MNGIQIKVLLLTCIVYIWEDAFNYHVAEIMSGNDKTGEKIESCQNLNYFGFPKACLFFSSVNFADIHAKLKKLDSFLPDQIISMQRLMHHKLLVEYVEMFCIASSDKNPQNYLLKYCTEVQPWGTCTCISFLC